MAFRYANRLAVTGIAAAMSLAVSMPLGAQEDEEVQEFDTFEVTGSRLKRTDFEGPLPVVQYSRDDIEAAGDITVSQFLRELPFNTFGSFEPESISGSGGQVSTDIDLRGLGSNRTLVILDGRRLPSSGQFSGAAQNLQILPLSAVERIEILKEGASAVYGSDAIGGVINIITRKDYQGVQFAAQVDRPTSDGGDGASYSFLGGLTGGNGSLLFSAEHAQRGAIKAKDRDFLFSQPPSPIGFPPSFARNPTDGDDPPNPNFVPAPNCPTGGFDSSAAFPNSNAQAVPGFPGEFCAFRFASVSGETPDFARDSFTVLGNYSLSDDINLFTRMLTSRLKSENNLAPAPAFIPGAVQPDDPNNPTRGERAGTTDGYLLDVAFRFVPLGNREPTDEEEVFSFLGGLEGTFLNGLADWDAAIFHNRSRTSAQLANLFLLSELFAAVEEGAFNFFNPSPDVLNRVRHTATTDFESVSKGLELQVSFLDLLGSGFPLAVGGEFREDSLSIQSDPQSVAGNVAGSSGGSGVSADRDVSAIYAETAFFLLDDMIEIGLAGRFDDYSDAGSEFSPKISFGLRPIDSVLARASYSEGFRAPDLNELFTSPAQSFTGAIDSLRCEQAGGTGPLCQAGQFEARIGGNPELTPEQSENISVGVVWSPLDGLSFALDYYDILVEELIATLGSQEILDNEADCAFNRPSCDPSLVSAVTRNPNNDNITLIQLTPFNFSELETSGIDFDVNYSLPTAGLGTFNFNLVLTHVLNYDIQTTLAGDVEDRVDTVQAAQGSGTVYAEYRGQLNVGWSLGDMSSALQIQHTPSTPDCTAAQRDSGGAVAALCNEQYDSYTLVDLQFGMKFPGFGTTVTLGVQDLFDEDVPISQQTASYIKEATNIFGRTPYLRIQQDF